MAKPRTVDETVADSNEIEERRLGMLFPFFFRKNLIRILLGDLRIIINSEEAIRGRRKRIKVHRSVFDSKM